MSDLQLGTKIQLLKKEHINTEIAFITHVLFPTGSKSFTNDKLGTINKLSISHSLSNHLNCRVQCGL